MQNRFVDTQITFQQPFHLDGNDAAMPAGTYSVDTEEEAVDGAAEETWRIVGTAIRLIGPGADAAYVLVDRQALDAALKRDEAQSGGAAQAAFRAKRHRFAGPRG